MTDSIADMLTRIRNGLLAGKQNIVLPTSKLKFSVAKILEDQGFVEKVEKVKEDKETKSNSFEELKIVLKYKKNGKPAISSLKKISKPGCKIYVGKDNLPKVLNNFGIAVISTPQGIMTNKEAKEKGLGGEVICEIY